jgi:hypothetical protein
MLTSLPLVSELHHPAMRSRHWTQLMRARARLAVPFPRTSAAPAGRATAQRGARRPPARRS